MKNWLLNLIPYRRKLRELQADYFVLLGKSIASEIRLAQSRAQVLQLNRALLDGNEQYKKMQRDLGRMRTEELQVRKVSGLCPPPWTYDK